MDAAASCPAAGEKTLNIEICLLFHPLTIGRLNDQHEHLVFS
jgi:hypothetical protein